MASRVSNAIQYLTNEDFQLVNRFKLLIIESFEFGTLDSNASFLENAATIGSAITQGAKQISTQAISEYFLQSITIPSPVAIEYEESDVKFERNLKRPENITMSFLETETGAVWRFLQSWRKEIVTVAPMSSLASALKTAVGQGNEVVKYMFADDQEASKKMGVLFPMGSGNNPIGKFPRIVLHGLKYASNSELSFSHTESGNLIITAEFSVNEIGTPLLI